MGRASYYSTHQTAGLQGSCYHSLPDLNARKKAAESILSVLPPMPSQGRNTEVLRRADILGIKELIMKAQLRWIGHVVWMDEMYTRLPKMVFLSELATGARNIRRTLKRAKDGQKAFLGLCGIPTLVKGLNPGVISLVG